MPADPGVGGPSAEKPETQGEGKCGLVSCENRVSTGPSHLKNSISGQILLADGLGI
jgi:hypothetical protein